MDFFKSRKYTDSGPIDQTKLVLFLKDGGDGGMDFAHLLLAGDNTVAGRAVPSAFQFAVYVIVIEN